ncbi:MAG: hypothetical protein J6K84_04140 [Oscillospiraceae bacterium]|nr:hypothetical protein [Oscillospiraceae bacterium]
MMKKKVLAIAIILAVLSLLLAFGRLEQQKMTLEVKMDGVWEKPLEDGVFLQLEIEKGSMVYRLVSLDFAELGEVLAEYQWKALDGGHISATMEGGKSRSLTATVEDGVLTFSPALTVDLPAESWQKVE